MAWNGTVGDYAGNTVSVLLNEGQGGFISPKNTGVGTNPHGVAVGDLDTGGGNYPDLVVTDHETGKVSFLIGNQDGTFTSVTTLDIGPFPIGLEIADLNADCRSII